MLKMTKILFNYEIIDDYLILTISAFFCIIFYRIKM